MFLGYLRVAQDGFLDIEIKNYIKSWFYFISELMKRKAGICLQPTTPNDVIFMRIVFRCMAQFTVTWKYYVQDYQF